ncbi:MAG: GTPase Era [Candidatus Omnitrophota bacterium]
MYSGKERAVKTEEVFKSGFVAVVGRPNVGKSTLVNAILKTKVSIVSCIPQTTRHLVRGILNCPGAQIVFVDTPGIHSFSEKLAKHLNKVAKKSFVDVELIVYVVDATRSIGSEEERVIDCLLKKRDAKIIMAINKIDINKKFVNEYIGFWQEKMKKTKRSKDPILYYIPVSAKTGRHLDILIDAIKENLPSNPPFYDKDTTTDFPLQFRVADIIREKLFLNLKEEVPHSLAVEVKEIEDKDKVVYVEAAIYVNRSSQKKIIIGKKGEFIKAAGSLSRLDLEKVFAKKVYLDLRVKVLGDWQAKKRILKELGYES